MKKTDQIIIDSVINWFEKSVLGLNLCPFAARPYSEGSISVELSHANDDESCLVDVSLMLNRLEQHAKIETLVLIIPEHLHLFDDYNQFLNLADELLYQQGWQGVIQIASFHPDYVFANCDIDDRSNWTNRSPYPLLHFIRESSISKAVQHYPDVDNIPRRNIELLRSLSDEEMKQIFD